MSCSGLAAGEWPGTASSFTLSFAGPRPHHHLVGSDPTHAGAESNMPTSCRTTSPREHGCLKPVVLSRHFPVVALENTHCLTWKCWSRFSEQSSPTFRDPKRLQSLFRPTHHKDRRKAILLAPCAAPQTGHLARETHFLAWQRLSTANLSLPGDLASLLLRIRE